MPLPSTGSSPGAGPSSAAAATDFAASFGVQDFSSGVTGITTRESSHQYEEIAQIGTGELTLFTSWERALKFKGPAGRETPFPRGLGFLYALACVSVHFFTEFEPHSAFYLIV